MKKLYSNQLDNENGVFYFVNLKFKNCCFGIHQR